MRVECEKGLVLRAVAGDRGAFDGLAETCRPWLLGLCFQLVRDRYAAEDLVQETFVQAWREISRLRDPERFRAWLSRIAVNACRMYLRRALPVAPDSLRPENVELPLPTGEHSPLGVDEALARLEAMHRRVLMLFYGEGQSHAEIGDVLALSPAAVKSRLHRARERLRREMLKMMSSDQKARLGVTEAAPWALRTILLVEPEEAVRESLRSGLTAAGYDVAMLPTGEAALPAAAEHTAQMLILDKHCGEPNWVEVLTLLQADAWAKENLPVAVLVDKDERDVFLAWQAGTVLCLTRPPSTEEVVGFVKRVERLWAEGWRGGESETASPEQ